ncbi:FecR family protein [Sorangium sp. So ce302]|uniref:FecR domain-containing protein n=1 Tax=Sorangium sp. So ce302 TaxID=3133297 RepID=UPI003F5DAC7C
MSEPERQLDPVAALLQRAAQLSETERREARAAFLRRVDEEQARVSKTRVVVRWAAPLAFAASVLMVVFFFWRTEQGLDYVVEGAVNESGYVRAPVDHPAAITFSDQTRIRAAAGTRLRIDETKNERGARISVERGRVEAEVTHTGHSDWRFVAGPFVVRVVGTRFELLWDADRERLEVILREGAVEVEGYSGSGAVSVRAGQRFVGDAQARTLHVSDTTARAPDTAAQGPDTAAQGPDTAAQGPDTAAQGPDTAAQGSEPAPPAAQGQLAEIAAPAPEPAAPPAPSSAETPAPLVASPSTRPPWSKLVSQGEFRRVVQEAEARGTQNCLTSCDAADLNALADAARYVGQNELAEQALLALRARYASTAGSRAAFLLGRLHESRGAAARARTWYETALREAPGGAFAAEALAGKMRAVQSLEGPAAARVVAQDYLRLYPSGVHAKTARQLAAQP